MSPVQSVNDLPGITTASSTDQTSRGVNWIDRGAFADVGRSGFFAFESPATQKVWFMIVAAAVYSQHFQQNGR
jgi:hypothetical protein